MPGNYTLNASEDPNEIIIFPTYDFVERDKANRAYTRTLGGFQRTFDWSDFRAYTVPLIFINSADKFQINQWWRNGNTIQFTLNTSVSLSTINCRMVNRQMPIGQLHTGRFDLFQGAIQLEAIEANSLS